MEERTEESLAQILGELARLNERLDRLESSVRER